MTRIRSGRLLRTLFLAGAFHAGAAGACTCESVRRFCEKIISDIELAR